MKIVLRGHIRNSFSTDELYNMLKYLSKKYEIEIYIHTWNKKQNNVSWRPIENNDTEITTETIESYMKDVFDFVRDVIIEDDAIIELHGNIEGKMASTKTNIFGWKRYIYGQYKIVEHVYEKSDNKNEFLLNTRFDLFTNSYVFPYDEILAFIESKYHHDHKKNVFLRDGFYCGIDNIIIGSIETNYVLLRHIHRNLDDILKEHKTLQNPEFVVPIAKAMISI